MSEQRICKKQKGKRNNAIEIVNNVIDFETSNLISYKQRLA